MYERDSGFQKRYSSVNEAKHHPAQGSTKLCKYVKHFGRINVEMGNENGKVVVCHVSH